MKLRLAFALALFAFGAQAGLPKFYVKTPANGGSDLTGDGTWLKPFATISNAVNVAMTNGAYSGTIISAQPGTYPGGTRMEYWIAKDKRWETSSRAIQIRAQIGDTDNPNPRATIIDGQHKAAGAWLNGSNVMICGFTVTNGVWQRTYQLRYPHSPIGGAGLYLNGGATASNMIVCCCLTRPDDRPLPTSSQHQFAAVNLAGGGTKIFDSFIYNCTNESTSASLSGEINASGLRLDGLSFARRCVVSNCWTFAGKSGGNRRGGGVYMGQGSGAVLDSCQILNCGTGGGLGCSGGGICLLSGVTVTNCLISGCYAKGNGGGISAEYGSGVIVDTTITNCSCSSSNPGLSMVPETTSPNQIIRRCKIVDCNNGYALNQTFGVVEDCLIENNTYQYGMVYMSGKSSVLRRSVIRNNRATSGSIIDYGSTGPGTTTVSRCWITGNTCRSSNGIVNRGKNYNLHFVIDGCVLTGNSGGYGIVAADATSFSPTSSEIQYLPASTRYPSTRIYNTTIANNMLNGSGVYFYHSASTLGGPQYLAATNCLVVANTNSSGAVVQAFNFDATVKARLDEHPEQVAYCAMATGTGANLPADPQGVAHNQIGNVAVREGTTVPRGLAIDTAYPLPELTDPLAKDIGDGTYTISKSADWGVRIEGNNVRRRIIGSAPDIGASEYLSVGFTVIFVR